MKRDLISLKFIPQEKIKKLFEIIDYNNFINLNKKLMGIAFFQPSTRTRLSFEIAMSELDGKAVGFSDMRHSRCYDNYFQETIEDFSRVISAMVSLLVIRHPKSYVPMQLAKKVGIPVINAGDGTNEHPTQALQDIWLMKKKAGSLEGKIIAFVGDISRNYRSMLFGLQHFKISRIIFLLPPNTTLPDDIQNFLTKKIPYEIYTDLANVLADADFVNTFTPVMRDLEINNSEKMKYIRVLESFIVNYDLYRKTGSHAYILNAGPRTYEVSTDMDCHPKFLFLEQVKAGIAVRKGVVSLLLQDEHPRTAFSECLKERHALNEPKKILVQQYR